MKILTTVAKHKEAGGLNRIQERCCPGQKRSVAVQILVYFVFEYYASPQQEAS
jgi:hypothetical protein